MAFKVYILIEYVTTEDEPQFSIKFRPIAMTTGFWMPVKYSSSPCG